MKNLFYVIFAITMALSVFSSCEKEKEKERVKLDAPVVSAKVDANSIIVSWSPVTNATGYQVEYKTSSAAEYNIAGKPTYSPFTIEDLDYGYTYEVRVKSTCGESESPYSEVLSIKLERTMGKPAGVLAAGISYIDVTWQGVENATSYTIEHKTSLDKEYVSDYTGNGEDTGFDYRITGLDGGVSYDVRISAGAEGYATSYSDVMSVTTTESPSTMISNASQFVSWLSGISATSTDVAALANDIDMSGVTITSANGFAGTLEGQGFAIRNLVSAVPLFETFKGTLSNVVLDESCSFNAGSQIFGAFVKEDQGGTYNNVVNNASVTFTAKSNVSGLVCLGGFVGATKAGKFTNCTNAGAVTLEASSYSHELAFVGGFAGISFDHTIFDSCKNAAAVADNAIFANPRATGVVEGVTFAGGGVHVGGFVGRTGIKDTAYPLDETEAKENALYILSCENTATGSVTLNHTDISQVVGDGSAGSFTCGGFVGHGSGYIYKSINNGNVSAAAKSSMGGVNKVEYILRIGGIQGNCLYYSYVGSSKNNGNVTVYNDSQANNANLPASVGGIYGCGGYNAVNVGSHADCYYDTMNGNISVSGAGSNFSVGGILGHNGAQIGNKVGETCKISCNLSGGAIYIGGLVGSIRGGATYTSIKSSSCAADIAVDYEGEQDNIRVGGLVGGQGGAAGSYLTGRDNTACAFHGSVITTTLSKYVGFLVGHADGASATKTFGDKDFPIQVSGTFQKAGMEAPETISASNLEEYQVGTAVGTTTFHATVVE